MPEIQFLILLYMLFFNVTLGGSGEAVVYIKELQIALLNWKEPCLGKGGTFPRV